MKKNEPERQNPRATKQEGKLNNSFKDELTEEELEAASGGTKASPTGAGGKVRVSDILITKPIDKATP